MMLIDSSVLPTIQATRVRLRRLTHGDAEALYAIFSDPDVMRYWSRPPMSDRREAAELLDSIEEHFQNRTLFQWGVARREDDFVIGTCTLLNIDERNGRAEIGYALGRLYWGKGYMAEALGALLDHAFQAFDWRRIEADVDPRNAASLRLLERLGFQKEGCLRERWFVDGETQDTLFHGLLRSEWERRAGRPT